MHRSEILALQFARLVARDGADNSTTNATSSDDSSDDPCGVNPTDRLNLRIGAIFVILVTSAVGTLFPVLNKRVARLRNIVPGIVFEFAQFFGSGVILATSLVHLLEPAADDELGPANTIALGGCIANAWADYPYAFGICLASLFATFVVELVAYRLGSQYLARRGIAMEGDSHGLSHTEGHADIPRMVPPQEEKARDIEDAGSSAESVDRYKDASENGPAGAQILGVAILEFGVIFHSIIIGLTLSLSSPDEFTTLFIVIIFHQMFEGLGLGTRLAFLRLPAEWNWVPYAGAVAYSFVTPLGMAIGLGTRESTSMTSASASIAAGILDSTSAGILLYAATVELIAHEFIFNPYYRSCSWKRVWFCLVCFALGAGIMALLGKWA